MSVKTCTKCSESRLDQFCVDKQKKDGLSSSCKSCRKAASYAWLKKPGVRERQSKLAAERYINNKDKIKERTSAYRRKNPEIYRKAQKKFVQNNPEHFKEWRNKYYEANKKELLKKSAEWWAKNPNAARAKQHRRRAAKRKNARIRYTQLQLADRLSMFNGRCYLCGEKGSCIDHVKPLSKGGADCLSNIRLCCPSCNSRKSAKWPYPAIYARRRRDHQ